YADNNLVLTELGARGVPVHLRPPAWERTLDQHARFFPPHDLFAPKSRFSLVEWNAYAPPGTVRYVGSRYKLVEDRDDFAVLGILAAQDIVWNVDGLPRVWIGNTPTTFVLHNGTGRPQSIRLSADTRAGPARADPGRTLVYRLGEQTGKVSLPGEN